MTRLRLAGVLLGVLVLAGCGGAPDATLPAAASSAPAPALAPVADPPADITPARVAVPSIGADSDLIGLGVDAEGRWLEPDVHDPGQASWYTGGPMPGQVGPAVILGHVNGSTRGAPGDTPGVFARLADITPGAQVFVTRADGTAVEFRITRVQRAPKTAFPTAEVFDAEPGARELRLITCGGDVANGHYLDSIIAYGVAVA